MEEHNLEPPLHSEELASPTKPKANYNKFAWTLVMLAVIGLSFRSGYFFGNKGFVFEPKEFKVVNQKDQPVEVDYSLLWQALNVVNQYYIEKPVDPRKTLYGAVRGAVAATGDPYTEFFTPEDLESFKTELKGSFEGIGAEIGKRNGQLVIIAPLPESPAQKAGLLPKDFIVQVNGQGTVDWSVEKAVKEIRGPKASEVKLTIYREGRTDTFEVSIKREEIKIKSVKLEFKEKDGKQIALLTLSRFGDDTADAFALAAKEIMAKKPAALVLDLRNDPGGYLDTAVETASYWLPKGELVVTEKHSDKPETRFESTGLKRFEGLKTIVLINGGSASASEILAGALQDHSRAVLVGEKSFGKGSVQEVIDLPGNSAVKVTVAKWVTPSGKQLNKDGLVPNIEVKRTEDDIANQRDPQMDRAIEESLK